MTKILKNPLFLLTCLVLFTVETLIFKNQAHLLYFAWIFLLILAGWDFFLETNHKKFFFGLIVIGVMGYFWQKPLIEKIEFWGDEMGVINHAENEFEQITPLVTSDHIAVPSLDYLNLHIWLKFANSLSQNDQEFWWRLPYMIYHVLSSAIFGILIFKQKGDDTKESNFLKIFSLLAFLAYLTNPILVAYSIEIRFYSLSMLSLLILWYGWEKTQHLHIWWLISLFFLSLNSTTFLIISLGVLIGQLIFRFKTKAERFSLVPLIFGHLVVIFTYTQVLSFPDNNHSLDWSMFQPAIEGFVVDGSGWKLLGMLGLTLTLVGVRRISLKSISATLKVLIFGALFYIGVVTLAFILKPHYDIGVRNYLYLIPILLLIFSTLLKKLSKSWSVFLLLSMIGLNLFDLYAISKGENSFLFKDYMGGKIISQIAKPNNAKIIAIADPKVDAILQDWNLWTLKWYLVKNKLSLNRIDDPRQACEELMNSKQAILVAVNDLSFVCPRPYYKAVLGSSTYLFNQPEEN